MAIVFGSCKGSVPTRDETIVQQRADLANEIRLRKAAERKLARYRSVRPDPTDQRPLFRRLWGIARGPKTGAKILDPDALWERLFDRLTSLEVEIAQLRRAVHLKRDDRG